METEPIGVFFVPDHREPERELLIAVWDGWCYTLVDPAPLDRVRAERAQGLLRSILEDLAMQSLRPDELPRVLGGHVTTRPL